MKGQPESRSFEAGAQSQRTSQACIAAWVRPEIQRSQAYSVADATGLIKLDAMENPYPAPPEVREAWQQRLGETPLHRYPDPQAQAVRTRLRGFLGLPEGCDLLLGNGSDELIQLLVIALSGTERPVLAPEPSFAMYRLVATYLGCPFTAVPLRDDDFSLDIKGFVEVIQAQQPSLVFLAYPNNPTGNLWDREHLLAIAEQTPGLVVIDEAYQPFADATLIDALGALPNVVVMGTLSKLGLAGARLGYLAAPQAWIEELDKIRLPYNINALTQTAVTVALDHAAAYRRQTEAIRRERDRIYQALGGLEGIRVFPSSANFLLVRTLNQPAQTLCDALLERKILIKNLDRSGDPKLADCVRVTIGTPDENDQFLENLSDILADR